MYRHFCPREQCTMEYLHEQICMFWMPFMMYIYWKLEGHPPEKVRRWADAVNVPTCLTLRGPLLVCICCLSQRNFGLHFLLSLSTFCSKPVTQFSCEVKGNNSTMSACLAWFLCFPRIITCVICLQARDSFVVSIMLRPHSCPHTDGSTMFINLSMVCKLFLPNSSMFCRLFFPGCFDGLRAVRTECFCST